MKIRDAQLQYRIQQGLTAGVWTFPVNLVDPVTEFKLWFWAEVDDGDALADQCLPYCISEIALVDGSEVIFAMDGACAIALYGYDHGKIPFHWHDEVPEGDNYWCIPICFGRWLEDPQWIFDPTRFRNPQIRITWNLSTVTAAGAAGSWTVDDLSISVWAKVMEEGAAPVGYLMAKEIKEFATLAAGQEITYLPTDFNIRKVMIRPYKNDGKQSTAITHIKISQDEDKWIPVDLASDDFMFLHYDWFDEMELFIRAVRDDDEDDEHFGGAYCHGVAMGEVADIIVSAVGWLDNSFITTGATDAGVQQDANQISVRTFTRTPFDTFCYPFGDQMVPADWLEVSRIGNLRLILTNGSTGYTCQIIVQQAHPY